MITTYPYNSKKLNEYEFYHICILDSENIIQYYFNLSLKEIKEEINKIENNFDYIVVGTIERINDCLDYINNCKYVSNGIENL